MKPRIKLKVPRKVFNLVPLQPNVKLIEWIDDYITSTAKKGELVGLFTVLQWSGDTISIAWHANRPDWRTIGALEELKMDLLGKMQ